MRINFTYIVSIFCIFLTSGCVDVNMFPDQLSDNQIKLTCNVSSPVIATRTSNTDYIYDYFEPTNDLAFSFFRWDQGGSSDPLMLKEKVLSAKLGDPIPSDSWKRYVDFDNLQYFPDDESIECGFVGCYPSVDDWVKTNGEFISDERVMIYNIDGKTDVMVSDFKKGNHQTGIDPITFRHALCLYKIYAYAVDQDAKEQWGKLDAVTFLNLPEQLFVSLPEDITSGNVTFSYSAKKDDASEYKKQYILLDPSLDEDNDGIIDDGKLDSEGYPVGNGDDTGLSIPSGYTADNLQYVGSILGGAPEQALGINVSMDKDDIEAESAVSIARDFQPGYTYNIILRFSTHGIINASVTAEDWPMDNPIEVPDNESEPMIQRVFTNLSRYGTANSYVVSSANMGYAFDCTIKGNGVNRMINWNDEEFSLQDSDVSLAPHSIKVIWSDVVLKREDEEWVSADALEHDINLISLVSDTPVDGKVLFEVKGSGHPDDYSLQYRGNALIGAYDEKNNLLWSWHIWVTDKPMNLNYGNGYISQDRNLGAVSTEPGFFKNSPVAVSGLCYQWGRKDPLNPEVCNNSDHNHLYEIITLGAIDMTNSHSQPVTFFNSLDGNWCSDGNDHQWGYISEQDDMVKTMYDPCPPGYRVNGNPLWEVQSNEDMADPVKSGNYSGWFFGIGDRVQIYYPSTSYISDEGEITAAGINEKVYQYSANPGYLFTYPPAAPGTTLTQVDRAGAYPVRCVVESSAKAVIDLSREQTANCYVIENTGYYKFNARFPGNAVGSLSVQKDGGGFTTVEVHGGVGTTLAGVTKVDVLWWQGDLTAESEYLRFTNNSHTHDEIDAKCPIRILDYDRENDGPNLDGDGYAYFHVSKDGIKEPSNVILAGYDINGNILWTWHMWLLPDGMDVVRLGQYSVLDRNLGATFAPDEALTSSDQVLATYGFYYQWGRKDPFVPPGRYDAQEAPTVTAPWFYKGTDGNWIRKDNLDIVDNIGSIQNSIANPTKFVAVNGSWQDTYSKSNTSGPVNQLWGYTGLTGTTSYSSAKTMWDPCPPGYKMIDHTVLGSGNLWDEDTANKRDITSDKSNNIYGLYLTTSVELGWNKIFGYYISNGYTDTDGLWLPFSRAIRIDEGSYTYDMEISDRYDKEAWLHTSCPYNGATARTLSYNPSVLAHTTNTQHAVGRTVRCLKE